MFLACFSKDPAEYSVVELKRWLECHGVKRTGKKQDLIDRVRGAIETRQGIDPKVDGGKWYDIKRSSLQVEDAPAVWKIPGEDWKSFPSCDIPSMFNYGHVYHYLVESISQFATGNNDEDSNDESNTGYTATAKPLRKGMNLMKSDFISDIQDNKIEDSYFVRAHVHHSMKNDVPLNVVIGLSSISGSVQLAKCNCKASALARCAHISALLLKIIDFAKNNGYTVISPSTSKPCVWNTGKKRKKNPKAIHEENYSSKKLSKNRIINWDPRPVNFRGRPNNQDINEFVKDLQVISCKENNQSMWQMTLKINYEDYDLIDERRDLLATYVRILKECLMENNKGVHNGPMEIVGTSRRSTSPRWHSERLLRITASKCKLPCIFGEQILAGNGNQYAWSMHKWISNNLWFSEHISTMYMEYGVEEEPQARRAYMMATGSNVVETGMWINTEVPFLGASPDGLILNNFGSAIGIVEIKCLKILKNISVSDLLTQIEKKQVSSTVLSRQCFGVHEKKLMLKEGHVYYYQIQLQLLTTGLSFCDFVLHTPNGPPSIQRITPNHAFQDSLRRNISAFWHKVFIPEYFEMRVPRGLPPFIV
ncbi:uncharacterized protein LOC135695544 [Rhopilema esculentum]|uniref:uncharacterized protein LOC135695544 n=1 Tax=Rhopilema esculentum TaxID=499914 RepID=UPI0031D4516F|eukprot:gene5509-2113_t